ncbi:hypothetical protein FB567DRAFT_606432 [Paraphoma chrysanthemicola]|uniref:RING-type domain-containing protein n=1 Tax=Paraphoma chrysanthemicola TaxID=798071 RepID=A0A8K0R2V8_9PLEO|nr:hypothetical protein FB567DRAFT_606432 [Paraphoma chrysanthemicola]
MTTPSNRARFWTEEIKVLPKDHYITAQSMCNICHDAHEADTVEPDETVFLEGTDTKFSRSEVIETIACHHSFHSQCLHIWLQGLATDGREGTCPKCRHVLVRSHTIDLRVPRLDSDNISRLDAAIEHFDRLRSQYAELRRRHRETRESWARLTHDVHRMNRDEAYIEHTMERGRLALNELAIQFGVPPSASLAPIEPLSPSSGSTSAGRTHHSTQPVAPVSTDVVGPNPRGTTESEDGDLERS